MYEVPKSIKLGTFMSIVLKLQVTKILYNDTMGCDFKNLKYTLARRFLINTLPGNQLGTLIPTKGKHCLPYKRFSSLVSLASIKTGCTMFSRERERNKVLLQSLNSIVTNSVTLNSAPKSTFSHH